MTDVPPDRFPPAAAGWIFFDTECGFCQANRRRWGPIFARRGFAWVALQAPGAAARLGVSPEQLMSEMWVLPVAGPPLSGVDAWIALMRCVWWLKPLALLLRLRGIHRLARAAYRGVARNRHCLSRGRRPES